MKLAIYQDTVLTGTLFTGERGVAFQYSGNYLDAGLPPISVSLPLQPESFQERVALPFFDGLLPEEQQRIDLGKLLHTSTTSTMRLLKALAGECVGNLTLLEEGDDINALKDASGYYRLSDNELEDLISSQSSTRLNFLAHNRLSLAGAQAKLGLYQGDEGKWFATEGLAPTTHIVKPASVNFPSLLVNEFFTMQLAQRCGIEVAYTDIMQVGSQCALIVERFDRVREQGSVVRRMQEDFCQALSVMPHNKYEIEGGPGFGQLFKTVLLNVSGPQENMLKMLKVILFNYLIGNCDAHAKNFSLYRKGEGLSLSFAPAYDLLSTTYYGDSLLRSMAMKVGNHSRIEKISTEDFHLFAEQAGISANIVSATLHDLRENIDSSLAGTSAYVEECMPAEAREVLALKDHFSRELDLRKEIFA